MSSLSLQSTTFVPSLEKTRPGTSHHSQICPDLSAWLGLDVLSQGFCSNPVETNDLLSPDCSNLDYSLSYSSLIGASNFELMSSYLKNEPLLDQCNGYNSYPLGNYDQFGNNSFSVGYYQMCDKGDNVGNNFFTTYSSSDSSNIYDAVTQPQTWFEEGYQSRHTNTIPSCESEYDSTNNKVGRYTLEERRESILRYLKKKHLRNFRKTIKYACRKTLAERRVRVRGRFAKNPEEEMHSSQDGDTTRTYFDYTKNNEEYSDQDWLADAIESLM